MSAGQGESANAILKTLEEPPHHVLIVLLTANEEAVLPTIRSRCRISPLRPMPGKELAQHISQQLEIPPEAAHRLFADHSIPPLPNT